MSGYNENEHPREAGTGRWKNSNNVRPGSLPLPVEELDGQEALDVLRPTMPDESQWDNLPVLAIDIDGKPLHMTLHKDGDQYVNQYNETVWRRDSNGPHCNNQIASLEPFGPYDDVEAADQMQMNDLLGENDYQGIGELLPDGGDRAFANALASTYGIYDADLVANIWLNASRRSKASDNATYAEDVRQSFADAQSLLQAAGVIGGSSSKPEPVSVEPRSHSTHNPWPVNPELQNEADQLYETVDQTDDWEEVEDFLLDHREEGRKAFANACARGFNLNQYPDPALDRVYNQSKRTTIEEFGEMGDGQAIYHTFGNYSDFLEDISES